jgi:hypothetical protein
MRRQRARRAARKRRQLEERLREASTENPLDSKTSLVTGKLTATMLKIKIDKTDARNIKVSSPH